MDNHLQPLDALHSVLDSFPDAQHAFAYGSGIFRQPGLYDEEEGRAGGAAVAATCGSSGSDGGSLAAKDRPMLDFIFAVEDPVAWHAENLWRHANHYSVLGLLGPAALTAVAERLGAGVYFNTMVPWRPHQLIKYGVVRLAALQQDLLHWTNLYCAGRLHKPVATLRQHPGVAAAQKHNLLSALRCALLLLPQKFSTRDLLHAICAISYSGDVRMGLAEDSRKVHRIVSGSETGLRALYAAPLAAAQHDWQVLAAAAQAGRDAWVRDDSPAAAAKLAVALPAHVLEQLAGPFGVPLLPLSLQQTKKSQPLEHESAGGQQSQQLVAVGQALAAAEPAWRQHLLRHAIHAIVGASSRQQAVSGVLTAGLAKSVLYGGAKLLKAWR